MTPCKANCLSTGGFRPVHNVGGSPETVVGRATGDIGHGLVSDPVVEETIEVGAEPRRTGDKVGIVVSRLLL